MKIVNVIRFGEISVEVGEGRKRRRHLRLTRDREITMKREGIARAVADNALKDAQRLKRQMTNMVPGSKPTLVITHCCTQSYATLVQ